MKKLMEVGWADPQMTSEKAQVLLDTFQKDLRVLCYNILNAGCDPKFIGEEVIRVGMQSIPGGASWWFDALEEAGQAAALAPLRTEWGNGLKISEMFCTALKLVREAVRAYVGPSEKREADLIASEEGMRRTLDAMEESGRFANPRCPADPDETLPGLQRMVASGQAKVIFVKKNGETLSDADALQMLDRLLPPLKPTDIN